MTPNCRDNDWRNDNKMQSGSLVEVVAETPGVLLKIRHRRGEIMKFLPTVFIAALASAVVGCSRPAVRVLDAEGATSVSSLGMTCERPFGLTQDCSSWRGPTKKINVGGHAIKVAGNADGTVVVLFGQDNNRKERQTANLAYELLKRELVDRGYEIAKVTPIEFDGLMSGYAIETTEPNYHLWHEFSVEEG